MVCKFMQSRCSLNGTALNWYLRRQAPLCAPRPPPPLPLPSGESERPCCEVAERRRSRDRLQKWLGAASSRQRFPQAAGSRQWRYKDGPQCDRGHPAPHCLFLPASQTTTRDVDPKLYTQSGSGESGTQHSRLGQAGALKGADRPGEKERHSEGGGQHQLPCRQGIVRESGGEGVKG